MGSLVGVAGLQSGGRGWPLVWWVARSCLVQKLLHCWLAGPGHEVAGC